MTQRARRASLVVVLLLLASLGTASAECAWVLWGHMGNIDLGASPPDGSKWNQFAAFATMAECEHSRETAQEGNAGVLRLFDPATAAKLKIPDFLYRCLPDTIDPRGPKGK